MTLYDEVVGLREDLKKFLGGGILHIPEQFNDTSEDEQAEFAEEIMEEMRLPLVPGSVDTTRLQCCKVSAPVETVEQENEKLRTELDEIKRQLGDLPSAVQTIFQPMRDGERNVLDVVEVLIEQALGD